MINHLYYPFPGIPDEEFCRLDGIPMTRWEIRALVVSRLQLFEGALVYDVGAGSGSVAVESALMGGEVFAVERNSRAGNLIRKNREKFRASVEVVEGEAPEVLTPLPSPHRISLGGTGGNLEGLLETCHEKLLDRGILVVTALSLEKPFLISRFFQEKGYRWEATMLQTSRLKTRGGTFSWSGGNPVTLLWGEKEGQ